MLFCFHYYTPNSIERLRAAALLQLFFPNLQAKTQETTKAEQASSV